MTGRRHPATVSHASGWVVSCNWALSSGSQSGHRRSARRRLTTAAARVDRSRSSSRAPRHIDAHRESPVRRNANAHTGCAVPPHGSVPEQNGQRIARLALSGRLWSNGPPVRGRPECARSRVRETRSSFRACAAQPSSTRISALSRKTQIDQPAPEAPQHQAGACTSTSASGTSPTISPPAGGFAEGSLTIRASHQLKPVCGVRAVVRSAGAGRSPPRRSRSRRSRTSPPVYRSRHASTVCWTSTSAVRMTPTHASRRRRWRPAGGSPLGEERLGDAPARRPAPHAPPCPGQAMALTAGDWRHRAGHQRHEDDRGATARRAAPGRIHFPEDVTVKRRPPLVAGTRAKRSDNALTAPAPAER